MILKVAVTGYYGIETPLPDIISNVTVFWGCYVPLVSCQEPLVEATKEILLLGGCQGDGHHEIWK